VRGLGARSWLTADALVAIARLGVARLRWHVAPADRPEAVAHAAALDAPGRPEIEVVDAGAPVNLLEVAGPPAAPSSPTLEAALEALTSGSWRATSAGRLLSELLGELVGASSPGPVLAPDTGASVVVLKPVGEGALDAARLQIESVLLDGRAPGGGE
jgi:hypothetical protein